MNNNTQSGYKPFFFKDRPAHLALMRASKSAYCLWSFMYGRSDKHNMFCLDAENIMADTGLSHNTFDTAKSLLTAGGWIVKTGMRSQAGTWDTNEYRVMPKGTIPQNLGDGKDSKKKANHTPEIGVPTIPQKLGSTVDTPFPFGSGANAPTPRTILGVGVGAGADGSKQCNALALPASADAENQGQPQSGSGAQNPDPVPEAPAQSLEPPVPDLSDARWLANYLWFFIRGRQSRGEDIDILSGWETYWTADFQSLLDSGTSRASIAVAIRTSQLPAKRQYYIRSKSILDQFDQLLERGLRSKLLPKACANCTSMFWLRDELEAHNCPCPVPPPPPYEPEIYLSSESDRAADAAEEENSYAAEEGS